MDLLSDLAVRKLSPGECSSSSYSRLRRVSDGHTTPSPCLSPRHRRITNTPSPDTQTLTEDKISQKYIISCQIGASDSSVEGSNANTCTYQSSFDSTAARGHGSSFASSIAGSEDNGSDPWPLRPNFLDLCGASGLPCKPKFMFSTGSAEEDCSWKRRDSTPIQQCSSLGSGQYVDMSLEPASMPLHTNLSPTCSVSTAFSYRNPAYQSAFPTLGGKPVASQGLLLERSSHQDISRKVLGSSPDGSEGTRSLLKWKGVVFTPGNDAAVDELHKNILEKSTQKQIKEKQQEGQVLIVELTRGWNSRLGFSLQGDGTNTFISAIYADSVAAKDGRLRAGDQIIMVNDDDVAHLSTAAVIDLLRKIRGTIGIRVLRKLSTSAQDS